MAHALETPLLPLARDFRELRSRGRPFVLATIFATEGSTYRKAGAQMLIADARELRGLLSGGCLELDLVEHARDVLETGTARQAAYDMRGANDLIFGIGSGCEGAMHVLLQRVGPAEAWQPLAAIEAQLAGNQQAGIAILVDGVAAGRAWWAGGGDAPGPEPSALHAARLRATAPQLLEIDAGGAASRALVLPIRTPPHLIVCGAGADARPLAGQAVVLGFAVTVCDHRPALLDAKWFPHCALRCQPTEEFARLPELSRCDAAIVMSHHLAADADYLDALAEREAIRYVGLLGPAPRRDRLLAMLADRGPRLDGRLRAPVGLDIGARTPEAIALAVAGELHAFIAGRGGGPWHESLRARPA